MYRPTTHDAHGTLTHDPRDPRPTAHVGLVGTPKIKDPPDPPVGPPKIKDPPDPQVGLVGPKHD